MAEGEDEQPLNPEDKLLELHDEFERQATVFDRASARATGFLALPAVTVALAALSVLWAAGNVLAPRFGLPAPDPPPFGLLQAFGTIAAVVIATLILAGQRRKEESARRRSQLTLHIAAQTEQKVAKLIQLVEEQRRHSPHLPDREDPEAERLAQPSEPRSLLDRLERDASG